MTLTVLTMPTNDNLVNNNPAVNNARQCSTLPRRMSGPGKLPAPAPPRRDPRTTLSVGRARAKSMVAGLEGDGDEDEVPTKSSSIESIHQQTQSAVSTPTQGTPIQPRTASIKSRPTSSRITAAELEDLFQRQQGVENNRYSSMMTTSRFQSNCDNSLTPQTSPSKGPLVYASIADMKRKKTKNGTLRGRPVAIPSVGSDLKRNFHSSPDLANTLSGSATWTSGMLAQKGHLSQEDMHNIHSSIQRLNLPPPNHPPPPPPVGQVVKVDVSRKSEYESTQTLQMQIQKKLAAKQQEVVSSFRPASNAKLYASPQDLNITPSMAFRPAANTNSAQNTAAVINHNEQVRQVKVYIVYIIYILHNSQNITKVNVAAVAGNLNPYAQPGRAGVEPPSTDANIPPAPPIPEPDYSMSESEEEADNSVRLATSVLSGNGNVNTIKRNDQKAKDDTIVAETSGNSNTSGSSTGSSSMPHSFSVDEIQKIRTQLKSSKSFPNAFQDGSLPEGEGDNSSSGVSSDQEIMMNNPVESKTKPVNNQQPIKAPMNHQPMKAQVNHQQKVTLKTEEPKKVTVISTEDARSDEDSPSPPFMGFTRNNSLTRKQAAMIAANRARALAQAQGHAVSLTQLPPPIEADSDDEVDAGSMPSYIGEFQNGYFENIFIDFIIFSCSTAA